MHSILSAVSILNFYSQFYPMSSIHMCFAFTLDTPLQFSFLCLLSGCIRDSLQYSWQILRFKSVHCISYPFCLVSKSPTICAMPSRRSVYVFRLTIDTEETDKKTSTFSFQSSKNSLFTIFSKIK